MLSVRNKAITKRSRYFINNIFNYFKIFPTLHYSVFNTFLPLKVIVLKKNYTLKTISNEISWFLANILNNQRFIYGYG